MLLLLSGCERMRSWHQRRNETRQAIAEVAGHHLYADQLRDIVPIGTTAEDSAKLAGKYIMQWAKQQLIYNTAKKNLADTAEILRQVERYRRQLMVYNYEQQIVDQKMSKEVTESEIQNFYNHHSRELLLREPIVRCRVMVLNNSLADDSHTRKLLMATDEEQIADLNSFALANAYKYIISDNDFVPLSDVQKLLPGMPNISKTATPKNIITWSHQGSTAVMSVIEYKEAGQVAPMSFAEHQIRNIILNQRKTDFLQDFEQQMFDKAVRQGDIVIKQ
ncbi:MAG TPA: hypothetical protein DEO38_06100 [Bacteroidales bacterium]|jgi:hypothetical protein|nr:hypothetical protein [Bacteroidales bacterium]